MLCQGLCQARINRDQGLRGTRVTRRNTLKINYQPRDLNDPRVSQTLSETLVFLAGLACLASFLFPHKEATVIIVKVVLQQSRHPPLPKRFIHQMRHHFLILSSWIPIFVHQAASILAQFSEITPSTYCRYPTAILPALGSHPHFHDRSGKNFYACSLMRRMLYLWPSVCAMLCQGYR